MAGVMGVFFACPVIYYVLIRVIMGHVLAVHIVMAWPGFRRYHCIMY